MRAMATRVNDRRASLSLCGISVHLIVSESRAKDGYLPRILSASHEVLKRHLVPVTFPQAQGKVCSGERSAVRQLHEQTTQADHSAQADSMVSAVKS
jgi:hypothetical protein